MASECANTGQGKSVTNIWILPFVVPVWELFCQLHPFSTSSSSPTSHPHPHTLSPSHPLSLTPSHPHSLPMFTVLRRFTLILVAVGQVVLLE